jgi:ATP-dependent Clp protease adaptor protein ClpS
MSTDTSIDIEIKGDTKTKLPNFWRVVFINDDYTPMDFVTHVLISLFSKSAEEANDIMLTVHTKGRAQVGLYPKEIAMQKCLEVRQVAEFNGHPLLSVAEEAE